MRVTYKCDYLRAFDALGFSDQKLAVATIAEIIRYYESGKAGFGLRIKKIHAGRIFEARISRSLRTLWVKIPNEVIFLIMGDHDQIRKFLKRL